MRDTAWAGRLGGWEEGKAGEKVFRDGCEEVAARAQEGRTEHGSEAHSVR
jgi:hypothetical protein